MDKKPRPFKVGQKELSILLAGNGWAGGLHLVTFTRDPGWTGYVRSDGTGLALPNPSHLELLNLRLEMGQVTGASDNYLWGV